MINQIKGEYVKFQNLEQRCLNFTKAVNYFVVKLPKTLPNHEVSRQLIRSAGSIGANYIEANDCISYKDFLFRIKLSKKEAKETIYWIDILDTDGKLSIEKAALRDEARQLTLIFASIYRKSAANSRELKMDPK